MDPKADIRELAQAIVNEDVVYVLGAGASLSAWPTGVKPQEGKTPPKSESLAESIMEAANIDPTRFKECSYPACDRPAPLDKVASLATRLTRHDVVLRWCESLERPGNSRSIHDEIVVSKHPLVITTNFDELVEQEFERKGREHILIVYAGGEDGKRTLALRKPGEKDLDPMRVEDVDQYLADNEKTPLIFKIHGTVGRFCVLAEEDYFAATYDMIRGRLWPKHLTLRTLRRRKLFFGYSINDWTVRMLFHCLRPPVRLRGTERDIRGWHIVTGDSTLGEESWQDWKIRSVACEWAEIQAQISDLRSKNCGAPSEGQTTAPAATDRYWPRSEPERELALRVLNKELTILYGPTGCGKSSILQFGLEAAIKKLHGRGCLYTIFKNWAELEKSGIDSVRSAIDEAVRPRHRGTNPVQQGDDVGVILAKRLKGATSGFLVLDQFEEVMLLDDEKLRDKFLKELCSAITDDETCSHFVIAIREEELGRLAEFKRYYQDVYVNMLRIDGLTKNEAKKIISGKAQQMQADDEGINSMLSDEHLSSNRIQPLLVRESIAYHLEHPPLTKASYMELDDVLLARLRDVLEMFPSDYLVDAIQKLSVAALTPNSTLREIFPEYLDDPQLSQEILESLERTGLAIRTGKASFRIAHAEIGKALTTYARNAAASAKSTPQTKPPEAPPLPPRPESQPLGENYAYIQQEDLYDVAATL